MPANSKPKLSKALPASREPSCTWRPALRRSLSLFAILAAITAVLSAQQTTTHIAAHSTKRYRNLLAEQGISQSEIQARVDTTFAQLFHGDRNTQAIYYEAGSNANGPLAYITDVANHDARTEGMSYGMMVAVQMNHKAEFDAIWNWANTYMLITDPANPAVGYFSWSMNTDGTPRSDSPAPDGEEYFVMSLYFADHRWGSGKGLYNYKAQADRILSLMRHHPIMTGTAPFRIHPDDAPFISKREKAASPATPRTSTVGPMMDETHNMMRFVPSYGSNDFSDPSYHLPAFYELWSRWGPKEDRDFWAKAAATSRHYFVLCTNPVTGLAPDYANFDGTPKATPFNSMSSNFSYDSWRTAANWSVDQTWWGRNPDARALSDRIQKFLFAQGIHTFADRYTLDGNPLSTRHSTGMVATTAVAGLAATNGPIAKAFVKELWNTPIPSGEQRYYDGLLYMMALLHVSGEFRIWEPR